ncbi:hypothetical protein GVN16_09875 [Emticicia sp. CRIBPO]|uniref:AbiU2 domain-containing protein n=1 Tax=Emticicia sp. CRIBPO TaxID=2683258 RepID=UPI001412F7AB|nr:hypothetical protein [Emticicia sp. CRIBPO]NBA86070.1 hypothetical protein [Emticicia sp. CRIBPO]
MFELKDFSIWEKEVWNILLDIKLAEANLVRLNENSEDLPTDQSISDFFDYFRYQQNFIIVIQLSKLLTDNVNQKVSFHKVILKLKNNLTSETKEKIRMNYQAVSGNDFRDLLTEIEGELTQKRQLIHKLKELRDRQYAHKDLIDLPQMTLDEIQHLIEFAAVIYRSLSVAVLSGWSDIIRDDLWDINPILKRLKNASRA